MCGLLGGEENKGGLKDNCLEEQLPIFCVLGEENESFILQDSWTTFSQGLDIMSQTSHFMASGLVEWEKEHPSTDLLLI